MFFFKGSAYATVWKSEEKEKYIDLRISTSEKAQDGSYIYSNWIARAIGHASQSLRGLREGDRIVIESAKISNENYEAKDGTKKTFLKVVIIEGSKANSQNGTQATARQAAPAQAPCQATASRAAEATPVQATAPAADDFPF